MATPLKVLLVEDSEDDALMLLRELRRGGYEPIFKRVDTPETMAAELEKESWDIIISDYVMPRFNGLDALKLMKGKGLDLPFIIASGKAGEETLVGAMKAGVHDYILKDNLARLATAVERELREVVVRGERKQAEEGLRKERDKAQKYLDVAGVIIVVIGANQRVSLINKKGCEVLGYKEEDIIDANWFDTFLPESHRDRVKAVFVKLMAGEVESVDYFENPVLTKSGEEKIIAWGNTVLRDQAGNLIGTLSSGEDITERKRAEEALLKSREEAQRLAHENAILADIGRIISSSLNIEEVFKLFSEEARKLISLDRIAITLANAGENTLTNRYVEGIPVFGRAQEDVFPKAGTATEAVMNTHKSLIIQGELETEIATKFPGVRSEIEAGLKSMLSVPLVSGDQIIGALHLRSNNERAYSERDLKLAESIANQIAGAIAHAQLYMERMQAEETARRSEEEAKWLAQENAILAEIGRIITSSLNIEEMYERFAEAVRKLIPFDRISINIINAQDKTLLFPYVAGKDVSGRRMGDAIPLAGTAAEEILRNQSSLVIQKENLEEFVNRFPALSSLKEAGFQSIIMVPLISQDQVIGLLTLQLAKPPSYTEIDLKIAEKVGTQIAGAIANAQLFAERERAEEALRKSEEEAKRLAKENATMAEIGRIISSTLNIEEVYERFTEEVRKFIQGDRITIDIGNPEENTLTIAYSWGHEVADRRKGNVIPLAGTTMERVMRTRSIMLIQEENMEDLLDEFPSLSPYLKAGFRSMMVVPLISKDQVIGVLRFRSFKPNAYTKMDVSLAERVSNQIAGAIANAQLFAEREQAEEALRKSEEEAQRLALENGVLAEIGRVMSSTFSIKEVYNLFSEEVQKLIPFDRLAVNLFNADEGKVTVSYVAGVDVEGRESGAVFPLNGSFNEKIMRTQSGLLIQPECIEEARDRYPRLVGPFQAGLRSMMSVPLISRDEVIGGLHFRSKKIKAYTERDLTLAESIAGQIAGAIANAQLYIERMQAEKAARKSEDEARRLANETAVIAEIGRIISSNLSIEKVYKLFSEEVRKLLPFDWISISVINKKENTFINRYVEGHSIPGRNKGNIFPITGTFSETVVQSRKGIVIGGKNEDEILAEFPSLLVSIKAGIKSFLSVPLLSRDEVLGVLHFRSKKDKAYSKQDLKLAESIALQIAGAIANAQVFNELVKSEEVVRRNEILLQGVLDALPVGVSILDQEGKIFSTNPARNRIWGTERFEGIHQLVDYKGWWADTGKKLEAEDWALSRAVKKGETSVHEMVHIESFDGRRKVILNSALPVRDGKGEIMVVIAVNQDITELKQAEERLRRSEEHFRSLIENSSDNILTIDKNQNISYVSPSAERMLGYQTGLFGGKNFFEFVHRDDLPLAKDAFNEVLQNPGITRSIEYRVRHQDGSWRIFQSIGKSILDDPGNPIVVVNSRDITERKNLENQLAQAQKLEAVGQLAAGIAHEINTPTQYVGDNIRFLQEAFLDLNNLLERYGEILLALQEKKELQGLIEEVGAITEKIDLPYLTAEIPKTIQQSLEGVERVTKIVRAMREFSHPGTKEKTLADFNKAIENTLMVSRNEWKYVAELVTDFDSSIPPVPCLLGEFNQAILNIIINAAHAIADLVGEGSGNKGTIKVRTHRDNGWAEVRISDTGAGIPEEIRSRIFAPFFTTKKVGKGTGQGLAIAYSIIVKKHGGTIGFETETGKGTTFIIRLPLNDGAEPK